MGYAILQNGTDSRELLAFAEARFGELVRALDSAPTPRLPTAPPCLERNASLEARLAGSYLGRGHEVQVEVREGVLGVAKGGFSPLCVVSAFSSAIIALEPNQGFANAYRFDLDTRGWPTRLVGLNSGRMLDYNGGPLNPPHPDIDKWTAWHGVYEYSTRDVRTNRVRLEERNGQLYLGELRVVAATEPGLFYMSNGEALDLRGPVKTWRNIPLRRVEATPALKNAP